MANLNFNEVIIGGRLTADPELKTTPSGVSVVSFTVAVNRRYGGKQGEEQQADFFNVTAWRGAAEFICKYFKKASCIMVRGTLQNRSWTDQNGQKRYATEIVADEAFFVDAKGEGGAAQSSPAPAAAYVPGSYGAQVSAPAPAMEQVSGDDELPF